MTRSLFHPRHTMTNSAPRDRDQSHDKYLSPEMDLGHERDKQSYDRDSSRDRYLSYGWVLSRQYLSCDRQHSHDLQIDLTIFVLHCIIVVTGTSLMTNISAVTDTSLLSQTSFMTYTSVMTDTSVAIGLISVVTHTVTRFDRNLFCDCKSRKKFTV
jgi:hypothetical protein